MLHFSCRKAHAAISGTATGFCRRNPAARRLSVEALEQRCVLDSSAGYLLVAEYDNHQVLRYDAATGAFVDSFVPKHSGDLKEPQFLVFGPHDHNVYVGSGHFGGPLKAVLRYDGSTGAFMDEFTEHGHLESVHGVIFGPDGNLYVGDRVQRANAPAIARIARFDGRTGAYLGEFVPLGSGGLTHPFGMVFGPSIGHPNKLDLYVGNYNANAPDGILRYDGTTGAFLGTFVPDGSGGLDTPLSLTFGPDGNLYVASFAGRTGETSAVLRYQGPAGKTPGAFIDVFVPTGSGGLLGAQGVLFGPDGNGDGRQDLYVSNTKLIGVGDDKGKDGNIKRYDGLTGAFIDTFIPTGSGGLNHPVGLTFTATDPVTLAYTGTTSAQVATAVAAKSQESAMQPSELSGNSTSAASGMSLVSHWADHDHLYSDLWAEEVTSGPFNGQTFAYLGSYASQGGVDIIDITDPTTPTLASTFIGTGGDNELVDIQVQDGIGYFGSNHNTDGGVYIVDMSNPYAPVQLARIDPSNGGFAKVHTLFVDGNYLYEVANRFFTGINVFDVSNPTHPVFVRN